MLYLCQFHLFSFIFAWAYGRSWLSHVDKQSIMPINLFNLFDLFWADPWFLILDPRSSIQWSSDPWSSFFQEKLTVAAIERCASPGNSLLVFLGYSSHIRQKPGNHSYRSFQHDSGAGSMWLISNSKDFLDVCKRTIIAKVKSYVYHIHTF